MSRDYPLLPWDPPQVQALREKLQKPRAEEDPEAFYLHRRFSIYLTLALARRFPRLHPNHLTLLAVLLAFLAPSVAAFLPKGGGLFLLFLAYHLVYTLDLVDGELARFTGKHSELGAWLDRLLAWGVHLLALSAYLRLALPGTPWPLLGVSAYLFRWAVAETRKGGPGAGGGGPALLRWLFAPSGLVFAALLAGLLNLNVWVLFLFPLAYSLIGLRNALAVLFRLAGQAGE